MVAITRPLVTEVAFRIRRYPDRSGFCKLAASLNSN
jgi:hypothetical protein